MPSLGDHAARVVVWAVSLAALLVAPARVSGRAVPVWIRLDVVENTAEGSAFDRCGLEATLEKGQVTRWRVFYGEARAVSDSGWSAIRPSSGCVQVGSERAATAWTLRGSPYFLV